MRRHTPTAISGLIALLALAAMLTAGCVGVWGSRTGRAIKRSTVAKIEPGCTSREQVLERFGVPDAIVEPGRSVPFMRGGHGNIVTQPFSLFSSAHSITRDHRVYFYVTTKLVAAWAGVPHLCAQTGTSKTDQLFVLINERTALVEDYVYKPHEGPGRGSSGPQHNDSNPTDAQNPP